MMLRGAIDWTRQHLLSVSLGTGFVAAHGAAYAFFAGRNPYSETIFPPCILLHFTGLQCPGCGGTRAMFSLLHGDVATSLAMNPLVIAGYVAVAVSLFGIFLDQRGRQQYARALYWVAGSVAIGAALWSTVIRNLIP
ncbi:MAG: DUF2752 domain-containing protein [Terrimesophilobacter sp.]